jgi:hypothetical protein
VPKKTAVFSLPAVPAGELASLGTPRGVAFQQIDAATDQPLGQRHAEMASAAVGPSLVEFEDDRAGGHESHMPNRPVVESGDFHRGTFYEKKKAGAAPNGAAPAVINLDTTAGSNAQRRLPPTGGRKMMSTDALNLLSTR